MYVRRHVGMQRERELVSETFLLVNMYQFLLTMFF